MKYFKCIICMVLIMASTTVMGSCRKQEPIIEQTPVPTTFNSTGYKIKSTWSPLIPMEFSEITFEVYVDSVGSGTGLVSFDDKVYDVILSGNKPYIEIQSGIYVGLTDVTGHMLPAGIDTSTHSKMQSIGFSFVEDRVVAYENATDTYDISSSYEESNITFESVAVSQNNSMTLEQLCEVISATQTATMSTPNPEETASTEKASFYNESNTGVEINGVVYSIGDYCNPSTYFEHKTPEGIVPSYEYNADRKVEMLHVSYISSDGNTTFVTTDGYVQSINTTSNFEFLKFYKGMTEDELNYILGFNLSKDEKETWKPISGVEAARKGKTYTLAIGTLTATLEVGTKSKTLESITLKEYLDFAED